MLIGIDTSILSIDKAGASVYTRKLIEYLKSADRENTYIYFFYSLGSSNGNYFRCKIDNVLMDTVWMQIGLPKELKKKKIDLLHCPAFKAPLKCAMPLVVTFYDLHILKSPNDYNPWLRSYCKFMLPKIAKTADKIITISEFSKKDIVDTFSLRPEKVEVTYCGIDERYRVVSDMTLKNSARNKYGLQKKFILYIGAIQPRKNIPLLLKAYSRLLKEGFFDFDLVFAGGMGWKNRNIFLLIGELGIKERVKFIGYVPEDELPFLYDLAEFMVYPSFSEGFGMPVLEAMACGCPVITSNTSSLPEVVGDAGIMVDPHNIQELEDAIRRVVKDSNLRREMKKKGLERAKIFSWEKCAKETLQVYKKVYAASN